MGCGASAVPRHVIREDNSRLLGLSPSRSILRKQQQQQQQQPIAGVKKKHEDHVGSSDHAQASDDTDCGKPGMGPCENPNRLKTVAFTIE